MAMIALLDPLFSNITEPLPARSEGRLHRTVRKPVGPPNSVFGISFCGDQNRGNLGVYPLVN